MLFARGSGRCRRSVRRQVVVQTLRIAIPIAGYEAISCIVFARCQARLCVPRRIAGRLSWSSSVAIAGDCCSIFPRLVGCLVVAWMHVPSIESVYMIDCLISRRRTNSLLLGQYRLGLYRCIVMVSNCRSRVCAWRPERCINTSQAIRVYRQ